MQTCNFFIARFVSLKYELYLHPMKAKRFSSVFLILVLALQLLPVKQAIRYFFSENPLIEEFTSASKTAEKNCRALDEDCHFPGTLYLVKYDMISSGCSPEVSMDEKLPSLYKSDIPTPPPNSIC